MNPLTNQSEARVRLAWGLRGVEQALARRDAIAIVDVLSFSTTTTRAAELCLEVRPFARHSEAMAAVTADPIVMVAQRREVAREGEASLSPLSLAHIAPGARIALPSPNGAACSAATAGAAGARVFAGCLRNATAVGRLLSRELEQGTVAGVTVVACGERWEDNHSDGALRFALEDYLGAGAILHALGIALDAEAHACAAAFQSSRGEIAALLMHCESGIELRERGYRADVEFAAMLDATDAVANLEEDGWYRRVTLSKG